MEYKFKVGDRVVVNGHEDGKDFKDQVGTIVNTGLYYCGVEFDNFIDGHNCAGRGKYGHCWSVKWDMVSLVKPETIVIYRKDDKVYALDKATGKKVCAKCHPEDEFDFNKGAEIAFNRLMGKEPEKPKEEFYTGKVICVNPQGWDNFYTKGKIYQFEDGAFTCDDGNKVYTKYRSFEDFDRTSMADWLEVVE